MPQYTLLPQINQFNSMNNFSQNILTAFILKELIMPFFILTNLSKLCYLKWKIPWNVTDSQEFSSCEVNLHFNLSKIGIN